MLGAFSDELVRKLSILLSKEKLSWIKIINIKQIPVRVSSYCIHLASNSQILTFEQDERETKIYSIVKTLQSFGAL